MQSISGDPVWVAESRSWGLFTVNDTIHIHAPIERCFLLATHVEFMERALGMRAVAGKTEGMVVGGDWLMWSGWRFGLPHLHESRVTRYERPDFLQNTMGRGRFKRFQHDHQFDEIDGHTLLTDRLRFSMPLGWPGRVVGRYVVLPQLSALMRRRLEVLKRVAESEEWRQYLGEEDGSFGPEIAGSSYDVSSWSGLGRGERLSGK